MTPCQLKSLLSLLLAVCRWLCFFREDGLPPEFFYQILEAAEISLWMYEGLVRPWLTEFRFRAIGSLNPVLDRFSGLDAVEVAPNEIGNLSPTDMSAIVGKVPFRSLVGFRQVLSAQKTVRRTWQLTRILHNSLFRP